MSRYSRVVNCPVNHCPRIHAEFIFCCPDHWKRLPPQMQGAVIAARRDHRNYTVGYRQPIEDALAYLEQRPARQMQAVAA